MSTGKTYSTKYLLDSNNNRGAEGQVLSTTSTGIDWVDANTVPGTGLWLANGNDIYNSNSGNVGIGTTSPTEKLHVEGNIEFINGGWIGSLDGSYWQRIRFEDETPTTTNAFNFETRNGSGAFVNHMTILNNGNVGIGATSPLRKLHVVGQLAVNNATTEYYGVLMSGGENADPSVLIGDWHNSSGTIKWDSSGNYLRIDSQHSTANAAILFSGNDGSTEYMRIASTGNVGIGTTGPDSKIQVEARNASNVIYAGFRVGYNATSNNYYDADTHHFRLGTGSSAGGNLYVGGGVYLGGTASANALDDYEEGTFQTNINSTNVTNYSYSGQNGRYTKIGRQVIVTFVIDSVTAGTGFKYFVISNLPFAQHTASHNEQGYCSNYPRGERRSGIIINNSSGESNTWYVGYNNNSSQSDNALRGTIIYTTT